MSGPGGGVGPPENSRRGPGQKFTSEGDAVEEVVIPVRKEAVDPLRLAGGDRSRVLAVTDRVEVLTDEVYCAIFAGRLERAVDDFGDSEVHFHVEPAGREGNFVCHGTKIYGFIFKNSHGRPERDRTFPESTRTAPVKIHGYLANTTCIFPYSQQDAR